MDPNCPRSTWTCRTQASVAAEETATHLRATPEGLRDWGLLQCSDSLGDPGGQAALTTLSHGTAGAPVSREGLLWVNPGLGGVLGHCSSLSLEHHSYSLA